MCQLKLRLHSASIWRYIFIIKEEEMPMKKIWITWLALSLLTFFCGTALAEEKVVQFTMPGCAA